MKGAYLLIIKSSKKQRIKIGSLGTLLFDKGFYIYVGSAMNSLEARIARHARKNKKLFWHIDYLLSHAKIVRIFIKPSNKKQECNIAKIIAKNFSSIPRFGCSDCKCNSHLFFSKTNPSRKIKKMIPGLKTFELVL